MPERSKRQKGIIRNYYENRDAIAIQRLQELVTELYLTEGKKRSRNWDHVATHLEKLGVREATIKHLRNQDSPEVLANFIGTLMK